MSSGSQFGPYQLLYPLGAGGMGQVFLARHSGEHNIERLVALKRILTHLSDDTKLVQLFVDEVRIAAQLNHGNIVQVIDHGCIDGQYYMAMEYVHGENLAEVLRRLAEQQRTLPLDLLLYVIGSVCEGLDYAHRKRSLDGSPLGIVHRDITPHNVMLSFGGEVKIADFGVARAAEQSHQTLGGELRGKLAYMSPEQAHGRDLDQRSDLFSLGIVLYEALTGRNPFARDNAMATLEAVRAAAVPSLALLRDDLPTELIELVHVALSRDAEHRPPSARALHEQLQQTMRLHDLATSPFDLADYLDELFPEGGGGTSAPHDEAATAVGRRADAALGATLPPAGDPTTDAADTLAAVEQRTISYLRQRHPQRRALFEAGATADPQTDGPRRSNETESDGRAAASPPAGQSEALTGLLRPAHRRTALVALLVVGGAGAITVGAALLPERDGAGDRHPAAAATHDSVSIAAHDSSAQPPATAPSAALQPADARTPRAHPASGTLAVRSTPPGARLMLDGRPLGKTPWRGRVGIGRHRIRATLRGHRGGGHRVVVRAHRLSRVALTLQPESAHLAVMSSHRCSVRIAGKPAGTTPLKRTLRPGTVQVSCAPRGGMRATRRVHLRPGATTQIRFSFGVLAINLQPWAKVSIDRTARGTTPLRVLLVAGQHELSLSNPGAGRRRRLTVTVRRSRTTRVSNW